MPRALRKKSFLRAPYVAPTWLLGLIVALFTISSITNAADVSCISVVSRMKTLDALRKAAGGCPDLQIPPPHIPKPKPAVVPSRPAHCVPDIKKLQAWDQAHKVERDALIKRLDECNTGACPPIAAVPECRCPKDVPRGACACALTADSDGDGIPDHIEAQLIEQFSPFLRFTLKDGPEQYRPIDPIWYITHSRLVGAIENNTIIPQSVLQSDPAALITTTGASSNLLSGFIPNPNFNQCINSIPRTEYHLDPIDDIAHHGADWPDVISAKNIGLFAHVSPFKPRSAEDLPSHCGRTVNGARRGVIPPSWYEANCQDCYKIEYYQFFGKNTDFAFANLGDHEGDWSILTLVYGTYEGKKQVLAVSHWAHGYEMRFDVVYVAELIKNPQPNVVARTVDSEDPIVGTQRTWIGPNNEFTSFNILHLVGIGFEQDEPVKAQNNELTFAKDPMTGEFTHPVVFVENGAHEFWPSAKWGAQGAPAHWGNDAEHSYLTRNIPNLGEIEHPMSDVAGVILGYNGSWGFVNVSNSPPPGPALHKSWNWFAPQRTPIACTAAD